MRIRKIRREQIGNILRGVLAQDGEEIIRGGAAARHLRGVVLEEGEEGLVANADAQILEEGRAVEIDRVGVIAKRHAIVDGHIHPPIRPEVVDAELPPPVQQPRVGVFVKDALAVERHRLVQPGFQRLVVAHQPEPPIVDHLVRADGHQVVLRAAIVSLVKVTAQEAQPIVFLPVVVVQFHHVDDGIRIRREERFEETDNLRPDEHDLGARVFVAREIIRAHRHRPDRGFRDEELAAHGHCERARRAQAIAHPLAADFGQGGRGHDGRG